MEEGKAGGETLFLWECRGEFVSLCEIVGE